MANFFRSTNSDILSLYYTGFTTIFDITVYSSSMLPYIQSLVNNDLDLASFYFSITLSFYALSQLVTAAASGFLAGKFGVKRVFLLLQLLSILGTLLYAFSSWPLGSVWWVILGKGFSGCGGACLGLVLSYLATVVTDREKRTQAIANFKLGNIIAPAPSSIVALILAIPQFEFSIGKYDFNVYTYPAWASLVLQIISISLNLRFLKAVGGKAAQVPEQKVSVNENPIKDGSLEGEPLEPATPPAKPTTALIPKSGGVYLSKGVVLVLLIFLYNGFQLASTSYVLPIVMLDGYGWSVIQYAGVYFILSLVGICAVLLTKYLTGRLKDMQYLLLVPCLGYNVIVCVFCVIGTVGMDKIARWLGISFFLFGAETGFGAFQMSQTVCLSLFTQVVPPPYVIKMMPLTTTVFALGRIVGPLVCELETAIWGLGLIYYVLLVLSGTLMFVVIIFSKHLYTGPGKLPEKVQTTN